MLARLHARGLQSVCASRLAALLELAVRDPAAPVDERDAVGHLVGRELEQVGEVEVSVHDHREDDRDRRELRTSKQVRGGVEVVVDALGRGRRRTPSRSATRATPA